MEAGNKSKISLVKKTLGKNGKYYHYESLSPVDDLKDIYWYKIDKGYYEFHIKENKETALKIKYNDDDEIIYMEYISKPYLPKDNKGCLGALFFFH